MSYQQLTEGQRYQVSVLLAHGCSQTVITETLCKSKSIISRELSRKRLPDGRYEPAQAQQLATGRRIHAAKRRILSMTIDFIKLCLDVDWSPEQISHVSARLGMPVSHEWIYQYVATDKAAGGKLYKSLRQGHKRYHKGKTSKRCVIPDPVSIDEQPGIVDTRERFGDWEIDTVLGKHGICALATIELLGSYAAHVHTITADNGSEFVGHKAIAEALETDIYFAHPYSSWERGLNKNSNGLLRQYIPKGTDLREITDEDVMQAVARLNARPRKCLGFR
ncbi:IS30 family transposase [Salinivibrio costicola]|uniref:IS30 family transposase n=1 Tax=Salinivibrio costicola subsp. alcaliphilus TaxID=272773 RepID=A0ABX3KMJ0_SALCS|nr:IS30 family transposase [Salinivibrio costicola]OOF32908.1 IS30 family transposase [Salinivibrio costicola subsp. alcaliphilus]